VSDQQDIGSVLNPSELPSICKKQKQYNKYIIIYYIITIIIIIKMCFVLNKEVTLYI